MGFQPSVQFQTCKTPDERNQSVSPLNEWNALREGIDPGFPLLHSLPEHPGIEGMPLHDQQKHPMKLLNGGWTVFEGL